MNQLDFNRESVNSDFNHETLASEARALHRHGRLEDAKRIYRRLLGVTQNFNDVADFSGLLFETQEWLECLKMIELALAVKGSNLKGLHDLYRMQGCCFTQLGNWEMAEDAFYAALEHPGGVDVVLVNLGTLDIQRKQWESATESFREAVRLNPENDKGWVGLALCHRFKGDHVLALANLEKALDINSKNETALGLVLAWYGEQQRDVVFQRLRQYQLDDGTNPQLWLAFVDVALRMGHVHIAQLELERLRLTHTDFVTAFQYKI